ncbi:hypothetical protein [Paenibacillus illinoisensis]|uniref:hypothetical protein n=1 Tax=Paenibacillus illinoisensis TaxID=59845 RepID=UPI000FD8376A|nr:hypothetical protein [Paenibacillus illinoisensis]
MNEPNFEYEVKKVPNDVIRLAPFFIFLHVGIFNFNRSQGLPLIEPAETWYNEQEYFLSFCGGVIHNAYTERAVAFFLIIALAAGLGGAE